MLCVGLANNNHKNNNNNNNNEVRNTKTTRKAKTSVICKILMHGNAESKRTLLEQTLSIVRSC